MGRGLGLAELGNEAELWVGWWGWGKAGNKAEAQLQLGLRLS